MTDNFQGHDSPDRNVVLRSILFPEKDVCTESELYFRADNRSSGYDENGHKLNINGTVRFDTYFNAFPVKKYKEYCRFSDLFLRLTASGIFVLRIYSVCRNPDRHISEKFSVSCICEQQISTDISSELIVPLMNDSIMDSDMIFFTLTSDGGILCSGEYCCTADKTEKVNIGIVICTFRREMFVKTNCEKLTSFLRNNTLVPSECFHVYVVDNGRTLEHNDISNEFVTLIPNANTGGSGGFTRGYLEALRSERDHSHILFMDDDIVLDCRILTSVYGLLCVRNKEYDDLSIGGAMINLSDRYTQHEAGGNWNGTNHFSIGNGVDLRAADNVFASIYYPEADYNAWWFFCFPSDWHYKYGDPLPFFIKCDDIEYSLRCAGKIALINGIAVWHDDFEGKYAGYQEYYIKRNELITSAIHSRHNNSFKNKKKLCMSVAKQCLFQRYFIAELIFHAYDDYKKGEKYFFSTDTETLNADLIKSCPELLSEAELKEKYGVYFDIEKYKSPENDKISKIIRIITLNGLLIPEYFYKHDIDGFYVCDLSKCSFKDFFLHKRMLHFDPDSRKGFVTEQKKSSAIRLLLRALFYHVPNKKWKL